MKPWFILLHRLLIISTLVLLFSQGGIGQVKISDNPAATLMVDPNAILELESNNKGIVPPMVELTSLTSHLPLTSQVQDGTLVYNASGALPAGYYLWQNGSWVKLLDTALPVHVNVVEKTTNDSISKHETMVLASADDSEGWDITLTLPIITAADNGLSITVKNIGCFRSFIRVTGPVVNNEHTHIDDIDSLFLTRWMAETFVAYDSQWFIKTKHKTAMTDFMVSPYSSFQTIHEIIEALNIHQSKYTEPIVIAMNGGNYAIDSTIVIDFPFPITIQGLSYGKSVFYPTSNMTGKPMFDCRSETMFKMLVFEANFEDATYGQGADEDAIWLTGTDQTYYEVKDAMLTGFYNGIKVTNNAELWFFEADVYDCTNAGLYLEDQSIDSAYGMFIKTSEVDFIHNKAAIFLKKGLGAQLSFINGGFYPDDPSFLAIRRDTTSFMKINSIFINNNTWNNTGVFVNGIDFSRQDGRDANVMMIGNAGIQNSQSHCTFSLEGNLTKTYLTTTYGIGKYVPFAYDPAAATVYADKMTHALNRFTHQSEYKTDYTVNVSGHLESDNKHVIAIGIRRNGTGPLLGLTTVRFSNQSYFENFSILAYVHNVGKGEFFEIWIYSTATTTLTIIDLNAIMESR